MDDQQAICDQGPMHCMNQAELISRLRKRVHNVIEIVQGFDGVRDLEGFKGDVIRRLQDAINDDEPKPKPVKVEWQTWENDGIELKYWDPAQQEYLENCTSKERDERISYLPKASSVLKEDDEVLCGGLFGWYLCRIKHEGGVHAETDHYYFPIKWSEQQGCWVTDCQINKACFDRIKLPDSPGAKEDSRSTTPADITASVRTELEGQDISEHVKTVTINPNNGSDQQGE